MIKVMDLNQQKNTVTTINSAVRIFQLVSGIVVSLIFIAMMIFLIIIMPPNPILYVMLFAGIAFLLLVIFIFRRQSRKPLASENAAHDKLTYANFTTDSAAYAAPEGTSITPGAYGNVVACLAPAMPSGISSISILGKATYTRQENTLLLTNSAIIGLQIPPSQESTSDSIIGSIISALPTEATDKNLFTSSFDRASLRETVTAEVAANSVEALMQKYYSFVVPFSEIVAVEFHKIGGIHVKTRTLGTFQWLSGFHEDEKFLSAMKSLGLPVQL